MRLSSNSERDLNVGRVVAWAFLIVLLIVTLFPFYWMLRTAPSDNTQLPGHPNSLLPVETTLGAFKRVLGLSTLEEAQAQGGSGAAVNFWLYLRNSLIVATITTVCQVFFSAMAAYAFARLRWPGRDRVCDGWRTSAGAADRADRGALVFLIVSFLTDGPRGRVLAGIVVGLVVLQFLLAVVSFGVPAIGVLHAINGLAIAAVASAGARRAAVPNQPVTSG